MEKTFVVTYIGLPDCQYKDVTIWAEDKNDALEKANAKLLAEYGMDGFDCLSVNEPSFHNN